MMQQLEPQSGGPLAPLDLRKIAPIEAVAASDRLGWVGLEADRYCEAPAFEFSPPAITHHRLVLYTRPPEQLDLLYEGVKRHVPPPAGAISLVPAGSPHRVRSSGCKDELHICLEPGLVARVAAEASIPEPHASLRGDEKRVMRRIPGYVRVADHLAEVVDAQGVAVASAQGSQVDHRAVVPEEGMEPIRDIAVADHLAGFVEIPRGNVSTVRERSQVRDGIRGRHTAVFQGFEAWPIRLASRRASPA